MLKLYSVLYAGGRYEAEIIASFYRADIPFLTRVFWLTANYIA